MPLDEYTDKELKKLLWLAQETRDRRYFKAIKAEMKKRKLDEWLKKNYKNAELSCKTKN